MDDVQEPYGRVLVAWPVDEYERHDRGPLWYLFAVLIGAALLIYALVTQNFLFAVIILMFGIILGLSALREPRQLPFVVTDLGVAIGSQFFRYRDIRCFWLAYDPPEVKKLYFEFRRSLRPPLVVPIHDEDPVLLRELLITFIDEHPEEDEETLSEIFGRLLKI